MESLGVLIYLLIGTLLSFWLERILVKQGYGNEVGLFYGFLERFQNIFLWPILTFPYVIQMVVTLLDISYREDDQQ